MIIIKKECRLNNIRDETIKRLLVYKLSIILNVTKRNLSLFKVL